MQNAQRLSPLQAHLWNTHARSPRAPWRVSIAVLVRGPLEPAALEAAFQERVRRHEILRTRFVQPADAPAPLAWVEPAERAHFEFHDLRGRSAEERERESRRIERALREAPGRSLPGSPLPAGIGAALLALDGGEHELHLAQSALATDWRSLWNLARELLAPGAAASAAEEPHQYADLAQWLHEALQGEDAAAGLAFWERVDPVEADLGLALESGGAGADFAPEEFACDLPAASAEALLRLERGRRVSARGVLLAVWQALLARLAERSDLVLGARSSGRAFEGLGEVLGPFERLLPVPARVDDRVSLLELARRAEENLAQGEEWHEFYGAGAAPSGFPYAFEYLAPEELREEGGPELLRRCGQAEPIRCLLRAERRDDGIALAFVHDPGALDGGAVGVLAEEYRALLASALARPEAPVASLSSCSAAMRARILDELALGPALAPAGEPSSVHEWILASARGRPEAIAASARGVELTYGELERRSAALAAELGARGIGAGALVGVHLERSVELIVALLGVLRAGAAYVPLPPSYPRERLRFMLADSGARAVVGGAESAAELAGFRGELVRIAEARGEPAAGGGPASRPEDLAYVIYTSGSTGQPKGVPITHGNLLASTRARLAAYPGRVTSYLLLSSFAFDSSVAGIFWTLVQGGTLVLPPEGIERELTLLPELVHRHGITHLLGLPSLWSLVLEQARAGELASLETVIVAGESCPAELVRRHRAALPGTRLYNEYGPTEGTVWSTVFDASAGALRERVPIGRPIPGARNYVLGPDREPVPIGVAGELWIGGPGVARGYLGRPELSAERFADDPFGPGRIYRTGDRARLAPDGNLEFLGRLDQQVKIRGHRIELGEIESALGAHPAVREAVVLAREDEGRGTRLVAYVTAIGLGPSEADLLRFLGERLPEYMLPARVLCLDEWPRLPNGKLDRQALPAPGEAGAWAEPVGALEIVLAALWADVLGLEQVSRHDDFFALGGHSLSATRLYARLKETLQVSIPLRVLFERRTPSALAAELCRDAGERARVERLAEVVLSILESSGEPGEEPHVQKGERALGA